jgi:hypothetical protein
MASIIDNVLTLSSPYQQAVFNATLNKLQTRFNMMRFNVTDIVDDITNANISRYLRQQMKMLPAYASTAYASTSTAYDKLQNNTLTLINAFQRLYKTRHDNAVTQHFTWDLLKKNIIIQNIVLVLLVLVMMGLLLHSISKSKQYEEEKEEKKAGAEEQDKGFNEFVKLLEKRERLVKTNMKLIRRLNKNIHDRLEMLDCQCKILARKSKNFAKKVRKNKAAKMKLAREVPIRQTAGPFPKGFYNEQELQRNVWNEMIQNKRVCIR